MQSDFAHLPGVPETALSRESLQALPENRAPAPWRVRANGVFWSRRPDEEARAAIEAAVPAEVRCGARPVTVIGGLISYRSTPVGPYSEVVGIVMYRRGRSLFCHVPFIAVDSPASVVGGRTNWALPKTVATFTGEPADSTTMAAEGSDWRIEASVQAGRLPLPALALRLVPVVQLGPHGMTYTVRPGGYGVARRARVQVRLEARPTLADWFPAGSCAGVLGSRLTAVFAPASH
jgi:Acetoacetate decarboxylase (ADC)